MKDEAERLTRHLPITNENYEVAWEILRNQLENPCLGVSSLLNKLIQQPAITTELAKVIKKLHDVTRVCMSAWVNQLSAEPSRM